MRSPLAVSTEFVLSYRRPVVGQPAGQCVRDNYRHNLPLFADTWTDNNNSNNNNGVFNTSAARQLLNNPSRGDFQARSERRVFYLRRFQSLVLQRFNGLHDSLHRGRLSLSTVGDKCAKDIFFWGGGRILLKV